MFETLKIYIRKEIDLEAVTQKLLSLGYQRLPGVSCEGDFSIKGDTLEVFPANFSFPLRIEWEFGVIAKMYSFDRALNKKMLDYDFLILIPFMKKKRRYTEEIPLDVVLKIKKNDYVVHTRYGIGKFLGVKKMTFKGESDYFFQLEYANKDMIYVPREDAHLIQKYSSLSLKSAKLTRLGGGEWMRLKQRVERGIKYFAIELLKTEAQRKYSGKKPCGTDTEWQKIFEDSFPYKETPDQIKALEEVKADMEQDACMDRLICGDVGYGKTEVAMRAAFKAIVNEKQVAFLVPTTILAYQHYTTLKKRLAPFPIEVGMLSRFRTQHQLKNEAQKIRDGKVDLVVGTHRLLSRDISFKNLGLLIIDDEQRFGVRHKEKIKRLRAGIDVLSLSATPIPRTLYMSLIGIKEISLIKTPPKDRLAVKTKIIHFSPNIIQEAFMREIERGGQVFFIHNRIETIHKVLKKIQAVLPESVRLGMVHGRLSSKEIERVMLAFIEKKIDCLVSTAIVESGIDIPSANTIFINDAHTFGLSDLHQLRGRVGRHDRQAWAYLVSPRAHAASTDAIKRLHLIEEFSHLGSGFDIAMSDLEMRGAGNILGPQQHGFIWMVGFDLYCRLLKKEIEYLRELFAASKSQ